MIAMPVCSEKPLTFQQLPNLLSRIASSSLVALALLGGMGRPAHGTAYQYLPPVSFCWIPVLLAIPLHSPIYFCPAPRLSANSRATANRISSTTETLSC